MRRESGYLQGLEDLGDLVDAAAISGVQERHWTYTPGQRRLVTRSFRMRMPCSWNQRTLEEPDRNQPTTDEVRFVVISGKPLGQVVAAVCPRRERARAGTVARAPELPSAMMPKQVLVLAVDDAHVSPSAFVHHVCEAGSA